VEAFCRWLSLLRKHGPITLNRIQKGNQQNGVIQILLGRRSLRLRPRHGKSLSLLFLDAEGVILVHIPRGQTISAYVYLRNLKTLHKRFRGVRPHKRLTKILLNTTTHYTQVRKHRKQSQNSDGLSSPPTI
jgi:hypothetical protein